MKRQCENIEVRKNTKRTLVLFAIAAAAGSYTGYSLVNNMYDSINNVNYIEEKVEIQTREYKNINNLDIDENENSDNINDLIQYQDDIEVV